MDNPAATAPVADSNVSRKRPLKVGFHLPEIERVASWNDIATMCRIGEDAGFDSIWMPDHLLFRFPDKPVRGPWECWSMLSAIAAITNRIEFGPLVLCTSFREPGMIAKMADTVEEISGGRLILGLGCGWHLPEYEAFGFPHNERVGRFWEAFTIIRTLLSDGEIDFAGKYYTLRECELRPRGPRPNGPPLLIGGKGEQMLRHTLPHVTYWNGWYAWGENTVEGYLPIRDQVDRVANEVGRAPETIGRTLAVLVHYPEWNEPGDWRGDPLTGTDEQMAQRLREFAAAGVDHVQLVIEPNTAHSLERFARVLEILDRG